VSGFVGVFPRGSRPVPEDAVRRALAAMRGRGTDPAIRRSARSTVGSVRHPWERNGQGKIAETEGLHAVTDAALFYHADLRRKLGSAGIHVDHEAGPAEVVLAAYRAWGAACPERLEGDFSFVVWDQANRRVFCARDFGGRKPLFFVNRPGFFAVGSAIGSLLALPEVPDDLDLASVAAAAAGLFASHTETAFRAVSSLPPGHSLQWCDGSLRIERHWSPPPIETRSRIPGVDLEEGAEQLRSLLERAVVERMDDSGPTAVWMSGGWDSTAVYGAGMMATRSRRTAQPLRPVSISYPPGDPGHEDGYIRSVANHWKSSVEWLDIRDIPFFDRPEQRAAERDEPFGHVYEMWNRALARASLAAGAHVALDGVGGDQLFHLSYVNLSDLLRRGRFWSLAREWNSKGLRGYRNFLRWAVVPELHPALRPLVARIAGPNVARHYLERFVPHWMDASFLERHGVIEREQRHTPAADGMSAVAYETYWYLTHPFGGKILSAVASFALDEGVELRSPLYDRRIVEFAASRPWSERTWELETKRLLRESARAWLPADVLAPRRIRTGLTSGYLADSLRRRHADWVEDVFRDSVLAAVGMVDANKLRNSFWAYRRSGDEYVGVNLFFTLQAELWLRAHLGSPNPQAG